MIPLVGTQGGVRPPEGSSWTRRPEGRRRRRGQKIAYNVGDDDRDPARSARSAAEIAENCEFFSFGTNDLTQMTYGYSRDDAASFLPAYIKEGILPEDPFASLDQPGVGELVAIGTNAAARRTRSSKSASAGSTAAIRARSNSSTPWAWTTFPARRIACRSRAWRRRRRRCPKARASRRPRDRALGLALMLIAGAPSSSEPRADRPLRPNLDGRSKPARGSGAGRTGRTDRRSGPTPRSPR